MKYWIPVNWDANFDGEGLLFFIQRMQEMLFHFSGDIYRAPVHNTSTLLHEFLSTYEQSQKGEVGSYQLSPILEELRNSFSEDKILSNNLGEETMSILSGQLNACKEENCFNLIRYIANIVTPQYLEWSVNYLKKHIPKRNHKQEIEKGIRCWLSEVIMRGYSAEFIYNYAEECLIKKNMTSVDDINVFFDRFDFKDRKYKVYLQISNSMKDYIETLEQRLSLSFADDGNFPRINQKENYILCYFEFEELDHYTAIVHAYHKINIFFKYFRFITNTRKYLLYKFGAVLNCETDKIYFLPIIPTGFKSFEIQRDNIQIKTIDNIILGVQSHSKNDASKLDKAITLHNSAIRQQLPKDGFINLLESAMDSRKASDLLKCHANTLKQLCPDEAKVLQVLYVKRNQAYIDVRSCDRKTVGGVSVLRYVTNIDDLSKCEFPNNIPSYLVHLETLGLLQIDEMGYILDEKEYDLLEQRVQETKKKIEDSGRDCRIDKGFIYMTPLGEDFAKSCGLSKIKIDRL